MYWQQIQHNLALNILKELCHLHNLYAASESLVGPVESIFHWSGGPVGWKC